MIEFAEEDADCRADNEKRRFVKFSCVFVCLSVYLSEHCRRLLRCCGESVFDGAFLS